uniref:Large his rich 1 n=1 Tax=Amblyomma maculatum TaxID=34609 RepID=G3MT27_AMBMU
MHLVALFLIATLAAAVQGLSAQSAARTFGSSSPEHMLPVNSHHAHQQSLVPGHVHQTHSEHSSAVLVCQVVQVPAIQPAATPAAPVPDKQDSPSLGPATHLAPSVVSTSQHVLSSLNSRVQTAVDRIVPPIVSILQNASHWLNSTSQHHVNHHAVHQHAHQLPHHLVPPASMHQHAHQLPHHLVHNASMHQHAHQQPHHLVHNASMHQHAHQQPHHLVHNSSMHQHAHQQPHHLVHNSSMHQHAHQQPHPLVHNSSPFQILHHLINAVPVKSVHSQPGQGMLPQKTIPMTVITVPVMVPAVQAGSGSSTFTVQNDSRGFKFPSSKIPPTTPQELSTTTSFVPSPAENVTDAFPSAFSSGHGVDFGQTANVPVIVSTPGSNVLDSTSSPAPISTSS